MTSVNNNFRRVADQPARGSPSPVCHNTLVCTARAGEARPDGPYGSASELLVLGGGDVAQWA
jgi:hypothetical protein